MKIDEKAFRSENAFAIRSALLLAFVVVLSAYIFHRFFSGNVINVIEKDQAKEAISLMKDWVIWMASIQTATIGALGFFGKDVSLANNLSPIQKKLVILVALFNTYALFISAWLLTSTSSLMLRIYHEGPNGYDFYTMPIYKFMSNFPLLKVFSVGYFMFWNHWLWGIGMLIFGFLTISMFADKSKQPKI